MNVSELTALLTSIGAALGGIATVITVITAITKLIEVFKKPKNDK